VITNSPEDLAFLTNELKRFAYVGGKSLVDMTLDGFGRDVAAAKELSEQSGVNIISGCGNYVKEFHPSYVAELSAEELAEKYIDEIVDGVGDTGIRPGMIGEIGTSWEIEPDEIKVLKAAAMTQRETGLPINVHAPCSNWQNMHTILDILEEAGADIDHVVLSHRCGSIAYPSLTADEATEHLASLAARGCYVEFDLVGCVYPNFTPTEVLWNHADDRERAFALLKLCQRGYSKKLLLSHDACYRSYYSTYGGWALTHVMTDFKRMLEHVGVPKADYENFIIHNPARMLTIR
jgi:phosphotriesterase-related protein